jgi:DNA invertase Pin-like site-specific DNA recombinase
MKYGYARVSTDDQNPALQLAALKKGAKPLSRTTDYRDHDEAPEKAGTRRHADRVEARPAGRSDAI